MYYHEFDYQPSSKHSAKYWYDYIGTKCEYGVGMCWDRDRSPMFVIEKVELVCISEGCYSPDFAEPPHYEPEGVETIIVRPKLKFPKR